MDFLFAIKKFFFFRNLKTVIAATSKIQRQMINLSDVKTIGIIYNGSTNDEMITVTEYAEALKKIGKDVSILAYQNNNNKDTTDPHFFNNKEINWHFFPNNEKVENFHKKNHDLLIAAYIDECLPLQYIAATSKAKFRVGAYNEQTSDCFELMIKKPENQNLKYLLKQINHFIQVINP
jgi:hypothetical protein